jgi:hypothetical protein
MNLFKSIFQKNEDEEVDSSSENIIENAEPISGEISAAISAAIFFYKLEVHDYENTILTIKRIDRIYSPWSSKIYGLTKNPRS